MTQQVSVQVTGMLKNRSAYITHMGFYNMPGDRSDSNMNPLVYFLKMNVTKNIAAYITIMLVRLGLLFLLQVSALVLIQVTGSGKSPITHITNIGYGSSCVSSDLKPE